MKTDNNLTETLRIPLDILMDALEIVVREELSHEVINLVPNRSLVIMEISYDRSETRKHKALGVIQALLSEYQVYRTWEHEDVNWKED